MIEWKCKKFDEMTARELYAIMRLRSEVFVVEQNCVYLDADNKDQESLHFAGWDNDLPMAYVRIVPPGKSFAELSIGRVVTSLQYRKGGYGRILMQKAIELCFEIFGKQKIKIGAQLYLKKFYESLGFTQASEIYLEDEIEHIEMIYIV